MVLAYIVSSVFLSIFTFAASTILQCFLLDEELGGSTRTPKSLQTFLDVHVNKKGDEKKDDSKKEEKDAKKEGDDKKDDDDKKNDMA